MHWCYKTHARFSNHPNVKQNIRKGLSNQVLIQINYESLHLAEGNNKKNSGSHCSVSSICYNKGIYLTRYIITLLNTCVIGGQPWLSFSTKLLWFLNFEPYTTTLRRFRLYYMSYYIPLPTLPLNQLIFTGYLKTSWSFYF